MKWSLRQKILLPIITVVAVAVALLSWSSYRTARESLVKDLSLQMQRMAQSGAADVEEWVDDRKRDMEFLAGMPSLFQSLQASANASQDCAAVSREFTRMAKVYGCYDRINLSNARGLAVASSDETAVGKLDVSDRAYFKEALTGKTVVSEVVLSKTTGTPVFMIATPVRGPEGVAGVLFGVVGLENFKRLFVDSTKVLDSGFLMIYDNKGQVIAHPDLAKIMKLDLAKFAWGQQILSQRDGSLEYNQEGKVNLAFFNTCKSLGWGLAIIAPRGELMDPVRLIARNSAFLCVFALLLTAGVVTGVTHTIVTPVHRMITALRESATQVAGGAGQITSASQNLASGASEQAASLEETTSALEEMAGMTRHNADNAATAKNLANQTRQSAEHGELEMQNMSAAMSAIKDSSDDIAKIIKTIDEIAFQTNILALNAAVEAARAGEAGMGFAVVADEVRNLARRSAEAAKETAGKIEGAIARSNQGVEISGKVQAGLKTIVEKARQVDDLIGEIATASQEQHQGISQINQAVSQMDKVTQANAAAAEESAAAAESLNGESGNLNQLVVQLAQLSDGRQDK